MVLRFINGYVLRNHELKKEDLWVDKGKIINPLSFNEKKHHLIETIDLQGLIVSPGFIDLQVNGAFGVDFNTSPEGIKEVSGKLTRFGITSFLPTLISSTPHYYRDILPKLNSYRNEKGANILGWHLEGPFLNVNKSGAHNSLHIKPYEQGVSLSELEAVYGTLENVKLITVAPELPKMMTTISDLKKRGIVVAAGHSLAKIDTAQASFDAGIALVTHLFNAMSLMEQREPGLAGAILQTCLMEPLYYSLIVDKIHVHPVMVALAWKVNPHGCILISDAISALDSPVKDHYPLGTETVQVKENRAYLKETHRLAGCILPLNQCLQNFIEATGCSLIEALETVTIKPAKLLNLSKKGELLPDYDADFVVIDPSLSIRMTFVDGVLCYSASP